MSGLNPERRTRADRRETVRRRVHVEDQLVGGAIRTADTRRLAGSSTSTLEPMLKLTAAIEVLAARLCESTSRSTERTTCTAPAPIPWTPPM